MVVKARCISRVCNKAGNIEAYILEDRAGKRLEIDASKLKQMIKSRVLVIENLRLTSDNRLILVDGKSSVKTNREKAEEYKRNNSGLELTIIDDNRVRLDGVNVAGDILEIPEFITEYLLLDDGGNIVDATLFNNTIGYTERGYNGNTLEYHMGNDVNTKIMLNERVLVGIRDNYVENKISSPLKGKEYREVRIKGRINSLAWLFSGMSSRSLKVDIIDSSDIKSTSYMFYNSNRLLSIRVKGLDMSNIKSVKGMYMGCKSLGKVDIDYSGLNGIDYTNMYNGCISMERIDIGVVRGENVVSVGGMFSGCINVVGIDISGLGFDKLLYSDYMFRGCKKLREIEMDKYNYIGQTMYGIFEGCESLRKVNLRDSVLVKVMASCDICVETLDVIYSNNVRDNIKQELLNEYFRDKEKYKYLRCGIYNGLVILEGIEYSLIEEIEDDEYGVYEVVIPRYISGYKVTYFSKDTSIKCMGNRVQYIKSPFNIEKRIYRGYDTERENDIMLRVRLLNKFDTNEALFSSLDVMGLDVVSNKSQIGVKNYKNTFSDTYVDYLNLDGYDISGATNIAYMFKDGIIGELSWDVADNGVDLSLSEKEYEMLDRVDRVVYDGNRFSNKQYKRLDSRVDLSKIKTMDSVGDLISTEGLQYGFSVNVIDLGIITITLNDITIRSIVDKYKLSKMIYSEIVEYKKSKKV